MKSKCEYYAVCVPRASLKPYARDECPIAALGNKLACLHYTRKLPCGHPQACMQIGFREGEEVHWCAKCEEEAQSDTILSQVSAA